MPVLREIEPNEPHGSLLQSAALQSAAGVVVALVTCCVALYGSQAHAFVRDDDSVWEVSSRSLSVRPVASAVEQLRVRQVESEQWTPATLGDLLAENRDVRSPGAAVRTIIYVHGNWTEEDKARQRGLAIYRALSQRSDEPLKFIIYSWPSQRERGFARDVIGKKARLDAESFYLACLMQRFDPGTQFSLLGFSFGGPVVCGALHLDAGGVLAGRHTPASAADRRTIRVSLTAPAFDRGALSARGRYNAALVHVDKVVNLYNSVDPVLKRFRFFERHSSPIAAGFSGLIVPRMVQKPEQERLHADPKVVQYDCGKFIGRTHDELAYYQKCPTFHRSLENLLGN